jgi:hypothetical protein
MEIRDYFAAQAIVGMLSNSHCNVPVTERQSFPSHTLQILAFHAYQIADAMMEASAVKQTDLPPERQTAVIIPVGNSDSPSEEDLPY